MCNQNISSNKFDLNLSTTLSSYSKLKETQGTAVLLLAIPDQRKTQWHKNI